MHPLINFWRKVGIFLAFLGNEIFYTCIVSVIIIALNKFKILCQTKEIGKMKTFKKNRKLLLAFSLVMMVILIFTACAPQPTATATQPPAVTQASAATQSGTSAQTQVPASSGEKVKILVMTNDAYARTWQEKLVPEFQKTNPNIDVVVVGVPYADLLPRRCLNLLPIGPTLIYL